MGLVPITTPSNPNLYSFVSLYGYLSPWLFHILNYMCEYFYRPLEISWCFKERYRIQISHWKWCLVSSAMASTLQSPRRFLNRPHFRGITVSEWQRCGLCFDLMLQREGRRVWDSNLKLIAIQSSRACCIGYLR